jgi:tetratricopeptide (TPR) repeat protein
VEPVAPQGLRIIRRLGEGGMGVVFEAEDLTRKERVAVKTLQRADSATLLRFKNEFRSFADLVHPNLVSLYALLESQGQWFLVMELLHGKSFAVAIRGDEAASPRRLAELTTAPASSAPPDERTTTVSRHLLIVPEAELATPMEPLPVATTLQPLKDLTFARSAFAQLAQAIDAIHRSGQLHRDIKPSNVHIEPDGRVVLLDFGVAMALQLALKGPAENDVAVGTPTYMAPELLKGGVPSHASDWYAFGVMLHDIITGGRAFRGPVQQVFRNKLTDARPRAPQLERAMPAPLAKLVDALLSLEPERRPGFADIIAVLEEKPAAVARPTSVSRGLVGRTRELAQLERLADEAMHAPRALLLRGRSGVGKSALLHEALEALQSQGAVVLGGRCYEHESVPNKSVDPIVDGLADLLLRRPELKIAVQPSGARELVRAFPVLKDVWDVSGEAPTPEDFATAQRHVLNALSDTLELLSKKVRLVCYVDDLQWGDAESVSVLAGLTEPGSAPVLVVTSCRAEEAGNAAVRSYERAVQHQSPPLETLDVERLSDEDCATLASRVAAEAGVNDPTVLAWARAESGGEPYFLHELLFFAAGQSSQGAGVKGLTLQHVLQRRAERLSAESLSLLRAVALSVSGLPAAIAEAAAGVSQARRVLTELRAAHLVRTFAVGGSESVDTFHDKVREIVSAACPEAEAQALHLSLYSTWKGSSTRAAQRLFALAHHGALAGAGLEKVELRGVLLEAAKLAEETFNLEQVKRMLLNVRELSGGAQPFDAEMSLRLGLACLQLGDVHEAVRAFEQVLSTSQDQGQRAKAMYGIVRVKLSQLDTPGALRASNEALQELGQHPVVSSAASLLGAAARWAFAWLKHRLFGSRRSTDPTRDGLIANLYQSASYAAYFLLDTRMYLQGVLRAYPAIRRLPAGREKAYWYGTAALIAGVLGRVGLMRRLDERAASLARESADPTVYALAECTCFLGVDMGGFPQEAGARCEALLAEPARWLDNSDYFTTIAGHMWNMLMRGHPKLAHAALERALRRADEAGSDSLLVMGHTFRCYGGSVHAMLGEPEQGARFLDAYQTFVKTNSAKDVWRNLQLLCHRTLFLQLTGADDAELEAVFTQHVALGLKPKDHAQQLRHFFIAKAYRRLEQAMRKDAPVAALDRLDAALAELGTVGKHPTPHAHHAVIAGAAAWLRGQSPGPKWSEAKALAQQFDQPWITAELELLAAERAKRAGDGAAADAARARASGVIEAYGLNALRRRLR